MTAINELQTSLIVSFPLNERIRMATYAKWMSN